MLRFSRVTTWPRCFLFLGNVDTQSLLGTPEMSQRGSSDGMGGYLVKAQKDYVLVGNYNARSIL